MAAGIARPFGERLRYYRVQQRLSQKVLGQLIGVSPQWVSAIERAERDGVAEGLYTLVQLLSVLRVDARTFLTAPVEGVAPFPGEWLAEADKALAFGGIVTDAPMSRTVMGGGGQDMFVLAMDAGGRRQVMERRKAISSGLKIISAVGVGGLVLNLDQTQAVSHAVGSATPNNAAIDAYSQILVALRHAEDQIGSSLGLMQAAEIHLRTVEGWLGAVTDDEMVTDLARLAAEYGATLGWMAFDSGQYAKAASVYSNALNNAQMLRDRPMAAFLASRIARVEGEAGQLEAATRSAERAVSFVRGTDACLVRVLVETYRAEVYARRRDRRESLAALDVAEANLRCPNGVDTPYAYWVGAGGHLAYFRGSVNAYLGSYASAQDAFQEAIAQDSKARYTRDRAESLAGLAESYAWSGDTKNAYSVASEAAGLLAGASSGRTARRLRGLHRQLSVAVNTAEARELGARLKMS